MRDDGGVDDGSFNVTVNDGVVPKLEGVLLSTPACDIDNQINAGLPLVPSDYVTALAVLLAINWCCRAR